MLEHFMTDHNYAFNVNKIDFRDITAIHVSTYRAFSILLFILIEISNKMTLLDMTDLSDRISAYSSEGRWMGP